MREIKSHKTKVDKVSSLIFATDEPDYVNGGGACHHYSIRFGDTPEEETGTELNISFQHGPVSTNGVNGITNEALLAVVADRLQYLQSGPLPSEYGERALSHTFEALRELRDRTIERSARNVEGKDLK